VESSVPFEKIPLTELRKRIQDLADKDFLPSAWIFFASHKSGSKFSAVKDKTEKASICSDIVTADGDTHVVFIGTAQRSPPLARLSCSASSSALSKPSSKSYRSDEWRDFLHSNYNAVPLIEGVQMIMSHRIGQGATKTFVLGRWKKAEKAIPVAVGLVSRELRDPEIFRELALFQALQVFPNVVKLLGKVDDRTWVLEYCDSTLKESKKSPLEDRLKWALDICNGLASLRLFNMNHGDLKPENVLIKYGAKGSTAKLTDFGSSERIKKSASAIPSMLATKGTSQYTAPEAERSETYDRAAADVYSLGRVILFLFTSDPPSLSGDYELSHIDDYFESIEKHELSHLIKELVQRCTASDPKTRGSLKDAASDLRHVLDQVAGPIEMTNWMTAFDQIVDFVGKLGDKLEPLEMIRSSVEFLKKTKMAEMLV